MIACKARVIFPEAAFRKTAMRPMKRVAETGLQEAVRRNKRRSTTASLRPDDAAGSEGPASGRASSRSERLVQSATSLSKRLSSLTFSPPVQYVYNSFDYALESYADYVKQHCSETCEVLLLGMNPGPFGMVQTGVPFGDVPTVRDWLGVKDWAAAAAEGGKGQVLPAQHPKRPLLGHSCKQVERSGQRLWSLAKNRWDSPADFFSTFWVYNYCPLAFIKESPGGQNFTPDKLCKAESDELLDACDTALVEVLQILQPRLVVGVGKFAEKCARRCVPQGCSDATVGSILHPSPASPAGNGEGKWEALAAQQLEGMGVVLPPRRPDAISVK
ncbi:single-strand selective monofunctional uracil DNA glycosylase-like [Convolutriloba macropyga]|uniref:single-strand selective monofunctional uracil DNA glycosylase-like n=1 Tax=Convolutriloba macropyga TaxID=536237 RepID=UPI003F51C555